MLSYFNFGTDKGHTYHELHDQNCKQIGQVADPAYPFSMDSQLPDPINFEGNFKMPLGTQKGFYSFNRMFDRPLFFPLLRSHLHILTMA